MIKTLQSIRVTGGDSLYNPLPTITNTPTIIANQAIILQLLPHKLATQWISNNKPNHTNSPLTRMNQWRGTKSHYHNKLLQLGNQRLGKKAILRNEPATTRLLLTQLTTRARLHPNPLKRKTLNYSNTNGMGITDQGASQDAWKMRGDRAPYIGWEPITLASFALGGLTLLKK